MNSDFENAYRYIQKNYTSKEAEEILSTGDDIKKTAVLLNMKEINDSKTANLIIQNLTNQSGPVREACAYKIGELISKHKDYFQTKETLDIILASLNDVNPNVVRFMLDSLEYIDDKFYIFKNLVEKIYILYNEIINKPRRGKAEEHIFTKKCFKIYWSLESIKVLISKKTDIISKDSDLEHDFINLINLLSEFEEYTIREKVAQIVNTTNLKEFKNIKNKLKDDENYFVKRYK